MHPEFVVHLLQSRPRVPLALHGVLLFLEDTFRLAEEVCFVGGVGTLGGGATTAVLSPVSSLIGSSSPIVSPVLSHLQEVGATAEQDVPRPSMGFPKDKNLVTVPEEFVDEGVQKICSDKHRCSVPEAEKETRHIAEDSVRQDLNPGISREQLLGRDFMGHVHGPTS